MVGDWVNLKNGKVIMPCRITVIGHATQDRNEIGTTVCVDLSKEFPTCIFDMDVITPIPLTPEILEKNGFEIVYDEYKLPNYRIKKDIYTDFYFTVFTGVDGYWNPVGFGVMIGGVPATLDYVHQLQHALKLCKIEKTIEL